MYVLGLLRGVRPMGLWSMAMILSRWATTDGAMRGGAARSGLRAATAVAAPDVFRTAAAGAGGRDSPMGASTSMRSKRPGVVTALLSSAASASCRMSLMSELLPEPETPVMQTKRASGSATSMFFRLFWRAPRIHSHGTVTPPADEDPSAATIVGPGAAADRSGFSLALRGRDDILRPCWSHAAAGRRVRPRRNAELYTGGPPVSRSGATTQKRSRQSRSRTRWTRAEVLHRGHSR